jgi:hypothetical protein
MLVDEQIQKELAQLPQNLKIEVLDFVLFLQSKQPKKLKNLAKLEQCLIW